MPTDSALYPSERLSVVAEAVRARGLDVLLLTPGPDLRYVTGYDAKQLERVLQNADCMTRVKAIGCTRLHRRQIWCIALVRLSS